MEQQTNIIPIETVLNIAKDIDVGLPFLIDGNRFKKSETLSVILKYGTTCVACHQTALYFQYFENPLDFVETKILRLMFSHDTFMTKDHIIPKSLGGPNHIDNYQPMCRKCNADKGNSIEFIPNWMMEDNSIQNVRPVDEYEVILYRGYIRWYTQIFHPKASMCSWKKTIKGIIITEARKAFSDFNILSFKVAYNDLLIDINSQPTKSKKGKDVTHMKPAVYFRNS